ncbi:protein SLOW WALKER 1-like [Brassica napus]|uniref:protein SLOW WALKER 1-like n=1 Tax=Brassica napus TaxID=3708 RepID=UPI0006AAA969|nr:protein SLOW WALKER 1-like [Brassica napus]
MEEVTASSENGVLTFDGGTHSHCIAKREDKCGVESRKFYLVCKTALERLDLPLCSNPMKKILVLNASSHRTCTAGLNSVKVWDLIGGGKMVCFMESHNKTVMSMCVGRMGLDENRLVIVSLDGYMKVFDYGRAKLTYSMRFQAPLLSVALSPDCSIRVINSMVFAGKKKLRNDAEKKQTSMMSLGSVNSQVEESRRSRPKRITW